MQQKHTPPVGCSRPRRVRSEFQFSTWGDLCLHLKERIATQDFFRHQRPSARTRTRKTQGKCIESGSEVAQSRRTKRVVKRAPCSATGPVVACHVPCLVPPHQSNVQSTWQESSPAARGRYSTAPTQCRRRPMRSDKRRARSRPQSTHRAVEARPKAVGFSGRPAAARGRDWPTRVCVWREISRARHGMRTRSKRHNKAQGRLPGVRVSKQLSPSRGSRGSRGRQRRARPPAQ